MYSVFIDILFCTAVVDEKFTISLSHSLSLCLFIHLYVFFIIIYYIILTTVTTSVLRTLLHRATRKNKTFFDTYYRIPQPSYPCNALYVIPKPRCYVGTINIIYTVYAMRSIEFVSNTNVSVVS